VTLQLTVHPRPGLEYVSAGQEAIDLEGPVDREYPIRVAGGIAPVSYAGTKQVYCWAGRRVA